MYASERQSTNCEYCIEPGRHAGGQNHVVDRIWSDSSIFY